MKSKWSIINRFSLFLSVQSTSGQFTLEETASNMQYLSNLDCQLQLSYFLVILQAWEKCLGLSFPLWAEVDFDQGSIDPKVLLEDQGQAVGIKWRRVEVRSGLVFNCPKFNFCSFTLLESPKAGHYILCIHFLFPAFPIYKLQMKFIVLKREKIFHLGVLLFKRFIVWWVNFLNSNSAISPLFLASWWIFKKSAKDRGFTRPMSSFQRESEKTKQKLQWARDISLHHPHNIGFWQPLHAL